MCLIDEDAEPAFCKHHWMIQPRPDGKLVAMTRYTATGEDGRKRKYVLYAHQLAMGVGSGQARGRVIDHLNGDLLDNRRENLAFVVVGSGGARARRGANRNSTTGVRGVTYDAMNKRFVARVMIDGQTHRRAFRQLAEAEQWLDDVRTGKLSLMCASEVQSSSPSFASSSSSSVSSAKSGSDGTVRS